jgi:alpha-L-fucosidase
LLIETRAKGGNLLLNVGPKPDGELPIEQEERLREVALWMYANQECIYSVRPWIITNEKEIWFTKKKDADTLYVIIKQKERWPDGEWKEVILNSVRATDKTEAGILGQNDKVLEYRQDVVPKTTWKQEPDGLHIRAMHTQRMRDNRFWPNPIVVKLTNVQPALTPPRVDTVRVRWDAAAGVAACEGTLKSLGDAASIEVGFEYRDITGMDANERTDSWTSAQLAALRAPGEFSSKISALRPARTYEVRALAKHPLLTLYGREIRIRVP